VIVADANLIAYLLIRGPRMPAAEGVFEGDSVWISPPLWQAEFLNVLTTSVRAGVIHERQARAAWRRALEIVVTNPEPSGPMVVHLALRRGISAYDAQYVVLAKTLKTRVVTGDKEMVKRCPDAAVLMDDFGRAS
jgi:predicted nucleic acid-binding protein